MNAQEYIKEVLEGKRLVGESELAAVKRWSEFEADPDIYYDEKGVERVIYIQIGRAHV